MDKMHDGSFYKKPLTEELAEKEANCLVKPIWKAMSFKNKTTRYDLKILNKCNMIYLSCLKLLVSIFVRRIDTESFLM